MKVDLAQLKKNGWHLLPEAADELNSGDSGDPTKRLLEMDLRTIGSGWIPDGLRKTKAGKVEASGILQIMKVRNVGAPKINEESKTSPRFLRISATDGKESVTLLDMHHHPKLSIDTLPGAKIRLKNDLEMWEGFIIVRRENAEVLGGSVDRLVEAWRLKRDFSSLSGPPPRRAADGSGPPPFLPFGSQRAAPAPRQARNFRAMDSVREAGGGAKAAGGAPDGEGEEEASREFEEHRRAVIEEARQQAGKDASSKLKNFAQQKNVKLPPGRGVDQMERRGDIERMITMGFKPRDAAAALRKASGDVQKAIDTLLSDQAKGISTSETRGRRGRRDRDPMDSDEEDYSAAGVRQAPPSGPATLLDFVTSTKKKSEKEGQGNDGAEKASESVLRKGQLVNAQWRDGRTYRARVEEVFRPDGVVGVFYLDYGEHDVIPMGHVTPLPDKPSSAKTSGDFHGQRDSQPNRRQNFEGSQDPRLRNRPRNQERPPPFENKPQRQQSYGNRGPQPRQPPYDNDSQPYDQRQQYQQQPQQRHQSFANRNQPHVANPPVHQNRPQPQHFNQFPPHQQPQQPFPRGQPFNTDDWTNDSHARHSYRQLPPQHFDERPQHYHQPQQQWGGYQQGEYYDGYPPMQGRPQSMEGGIGHHGGVPYGNMQFVRGGHGRPFSARR